MTTGSRDELIRRIASTSEYEAMAAIREATSRADPAVLPALVSAARSGDEWVSSAAIESLGAQAALLNGAGSDQRSAVVAALVGCLGGAPPTAADLPFTLGPESPPMAAQAAASMLNELDGVRFEAARSLGLIGDPSAIPVLVQCLRTEHEGGELRKACGLALSVIAQCDPGSSETVRSVLDAWLAARPPFLPDDIGARMAEERLRQAVGTALSELDPAR